MSNAVSVTGMEVSLMQSTHNDHELDHVYNLGRRAFREGQARDDNPFQLTIEIDMRREEWFRGWDDEKQVREHADRERS